MREFPQFSEKFPSKKCTTWFFSCRAGAFTGWYFFQHFFFFFMPCQCIRWLVHIAATFSRIANCKQKAVFGKQKNCEPAWNHFFVSSLVLAFKIHVVTSSHRKSYDVMLQNISQTFVNQRDLCAEYTVKWLGFFVMEGMNSLIVWNSRTFPWFSLY